MSIRVLIRVWARVKDLGWWLIGLFGFSSFGLRNRFDLGLIGFSWVFGVNGS